MVELLTEAVRVLWGAHTMRLLRLQSDHPEHYMQRHFVLPFFTLSKDVDRRYAMTTYFYINALAPHILSEEQRAALRDPMRLGVTRTQMLSNRPHQTRGREEDRDLPRGSAPGANDAQSSTWQAEEQEETSHRGGGRWSRGQWNQQGAERGWQGQRRGRHWQAHGNDDANQGGWV